MTRLLKGWGMPELSREAMQLLELSPAWRLRGRLQAADAPKDREGIMIAAIAQDQAAQRLWASVAKAMVGLGYENASVQDALIMHSPLADRVQSEFAKRKPAQLLSFGEDLSDALEQTIANAVAGTTIQRLPSLQVMTSGPESAGAKRRLWSLLVAFRKS